MRIKAIAAAMYMAFIAAEEDFINAKKFSELPSKRQRSLSGSAQIPKSMEILANELNQTSSVELLAAAAHMANRSYCMSIGDDSQPIWSQAPEWQRNSAFKGVEGVLSGNTPQKSHESWMKEKIETGWKYGPVKDPLRKEHPCMVDFDDLPDNQKIKDVIFTETVREVYYALTGYKPWEGK